MILPNPPATIEGQKAEEQIQVQLLAEAINRVITENGNALAAEGRAPQLNAVFGALATNLAAALSAIEKPAHRRMMREAFDHAVIRGLKDYDARGCGKARVFVCHPRSRLS